MTTRLKPIKDHGLLTGLGDDDHSQYYNAARLSSALASYATQSYVAAGFQPLDGDLTSLAGATGTNTLYYRSAANTWSPVTIGANLTFSGGTLAANSGTGDVVGPASATDNALVRFDTTTGKLVQSSSASLSDAGDLATTSLTIGAGLQITHAGSNPGFVSTTGNGFVFQDNSGFFYLCRTSLGVTGGVRITHAANSTDVDLRNLESNTCRITATSSGRTQIKGNPELAIRSGSANPATSDITSAFGSPWKNTTTGEVLFWFNDSGSMVSIGGLNFARTWNNGATAFTGLDVNVTDTASANGSELFDFQVGGTSKLALRKTASGTNQPELYRLIFSDSCSLAWSAPYGSLSLRNAANSADANFLCASITVSYGISATNFVTTNAVEIASSSWRGGRGITIISSSNIAWSSTTGVAGTVDAGLARNAAGVLEVNSGTAGNLRDLTLRNMTMSGTQKVGAYTVASLPAAAANSGCEAQVTDSTVPSAGNFGATVSGGGSNRVKVFSNGANWVIV